MIKNFSNQLQTSLEQRDKQKIESPQRNRRYVKFTGWAQPRMEGTQERNELEGGKYPSEQQTGNQTGKKKERA